MPHPPLKVRVLLTATRLMTRLRLAPTVEQLIAKPIPDRLALGPSAAMVGEVPDVDTEDVDLPTRDGAVIRLRVYRPPHPASAVLYAHGGGFVGGGLVSCDHICRRIAVESAAIVVSVEYRLAPEWPFPTPLDDVEDAWDWMTDAFPAPERRVVGGDSAGGNLAAALAVRRRGRADAPHVQLLIYPAVDLTGTDEGLLTYRGVGLTTRDCHTIAAAYLGDADPRAPEASPLHAPDLTGLPPAFVITVEHDPLREQGARYAGRLRDAGVDCAHLDVPRHVHGSLSIPALYDGIDDIHRDIAAFVRGDAQT